MSPPALRVVLDGDSNKIYSRGDRVTGRVTLVLEEEQYVESLRVLFAGNCTTTTTRPFNVTGGESNSRRESQEKIRLFNREKDILQQSTLAATKYHWLFDFTFPDLTRPRYAQITHGASYLKDPHPLPPSFHLKTDVPDGVAHIQYFLQARLDLGKSKGVKRCRQVLPYHPAPQEDVPASREAECTSTVLYRQAWKPVKQAVTAHQTKARRVFSKISPCSLADNSPRIIPSIINPESIAPGQHIPISLNLRNTRDVFDESQEGCTIDSLSIAISTYTTSKCGSTIAAPEDVVSKHITCVTRTNMAMHIPFGVTKPLTSNFRLINNGQCFPTFKTYTITRRYALNISIGIKYADQHFTIRSTTPLEIQPRVPRHHSPPSYEETEEVEPLPLYMPREPASEGTPEYESLSRRSSAETALTPSYSRGSSYISGSSAGASTPASEVEGLVFERAVGERV
jgi:hypothetical protein